MVAPRAAEAITDRADRAPPTPTMAHHGLAHTPHTLVLPWVAWVRTVRLVVAGGSVTLSSG